MSTPYPHPEMKSPALDSYGQAAHWAGAAIGEDRFADLPYITVSITRGADGRWHAYVTGMPAADLARGGVIRGGNRLTLVDEHGPEWRQMGPGAYVAPVGTPEPAQPLLDLGDIASAGRQDRGDGRPYDGPAGRQNVQAMAPGGVPVPPEALGSFFVPGPFDSAVRGAIRADEDKARRSVYDAPADAAPLELDLAEEPKQGKPKRETRRERRRREIAERAAAAADTAGADAAVDAGLTDPTRLDLRMRDLPAVPPSGHRPGPDGVAPVEWPGCMAGLARAGEDYRCHRKHDPAVLPAARVHVTDDRSVTWRDHEAGAYYLSADNRREFRFI